MTEPLDLRAVEARHQTYLNEGYVDESAEDVSALLALLRETRAALREALSLSPSHPLFPNAHEIHERATAVLAAAQDGP